MLDAAYCEKLRRAMGDQMGAYDALLAEFNAACGSLNTEYAADPLYPKILTTLLKEKAMKVKKGEGVEGEITADYLRARVNSPFMRRMAEGTSQAQSTPSM